eukprot:GDKK01076100.1.p1 GENE.GDKK01076100.1~~GDKK01076100.1.p1  ORF type:complete len:664 (+),score=147.99 GDKK01076100.1:272-1993(+)
MNNSSGIINNFAFSTSRKHLTRNFKDEDWVRLSTGDCAARHLRAFSLSFATLKKCVTEQIDRVIDVIHNDIPKRKFNAMRLLYHPIVALHKDPDVILNDIRKGGVINFMSNRTKFDNSSHCNSTKSERMLNEMPLTPMNNLTPINNLTPSAYDSRLSVQQINFQQQIMGKFNSYGLQVPKFAFAHSKSSSGVQKAVLGSHSRSNKGANALLAIAKNGEKLTTSERQKYMGSNLQKMSIPVDERDVVSHPMKRSSDEEEGEIRLRKEKSQSQDIDDLRGDNLHLNAEQGSQISEPDGDTDEDEYADQPTTHYQTSSFISMDDIEHLKNGSSKKSFFRDRKSNNSEDDVVIDCLEWIIDPFTAKTIDPYHISAPVTLGLKEVGKDSPHQDKLTVLEEMYAGAGLKTRKVVGVGGLEVGHEIGIELHWSRLKKGSHLNFKDTEVYVRQEEEEDDDDDGHYALKKNAMDDCRNPRSFSSGDPTLAMSCWLHADLLHSSKIDEVVPSNIREVPVEIPLVTLKGKTDLDVRVSKSVLDLSNVVMQLEFEMDSDEEVSHSKPVKFVQNFDYCSDSVFSNF